MRKILVLAIVVVFTGMAAFGAGVTLGTFSVSPNGTFLEQSSNDNCSFGTAVAGCVASDFNPTFIDLATLSGYTAGDTLEIIALGTICFMPGPSCSMPAYLGGVFDTSNALLAPTSSSRLPGAVQTVEPDITNPNTFAYYGNINTIVPQDFYIPATVNGLTVTAPVNAQYLVVGALDSFFADNTGTNLGVEVVDLTPQQQNAPEPATYLMVLTGIAGVGLFRKKLSR